MSRYDDLPREVADTIAAAGFDVYMPATGARSYLFFTDGTRIGYIQRGDWGGLSLSTVHVPNHTSGTGFRMTDDNDPPPELTRANLELGFAVAPHWADARMRESVRKWPDMAAFLASRSPVAFVLVAKGAGR